MAIGTGLASTIRVKRESVSYGTQPVANYIKVGFTSEGIQKALKRGTSSNLTTNRATPSLFTLGQSVSGPINGVITYENIDWLIYGILGGVATTPDTGNDFFTNIYTPAAVSSLPSFHIEVLRGNIPAAKVYRYSGCYVSELTLSYNYNADCTYAATIVGYDDESASGGDTPEATGTTTAMEEAVNPLDFDTTRTPAGGIDIGEGAAAAKCVRQATVRLVQPYDIERGCLGPSSARQPLPSGQLQVTGEFVIEYEDRAEYDAFIAQTAETGYIAYTSPTTIPASSPATKYSHKIFLNAFKYDAPATAFTEGPGMLIARIPWTAYGTAGSSTTAQPIAVQTVNFIKADTAL